MSEQSRTITGLPRRSTSGARSVTGDLSALRAKNRNAATEPQQPTAADSTRAGAVTEYHAQSFGTLEGVTVAPVQGHDRLYAAVLTLGLPCGSDSTLFLERWDGTALTPVLTAVSDDYVSIGRDVESQVLARAVHAHIHHRAFMNGNKTIVFPASPGSYKSERMG